MSRLMKFLPVIMGSKYRILPQNLLVSPGTQWEDFEVAGDWTVTAGSAAANVAEFKTGTQSMKLTSIVGGAGRMNKTVNWDMSSFSHISIQIYMHDTLANYTGAGIQLHLANDVAMTQYMIAYLPSGWRRAGWNLLNYAKLDFSSVGGGTFTSPIVKIKFVVTPTAGNTVSISVDDLIIYPSCLPAVMLHFDDGMATQYSVAYQRMKAHNMRGTLFLNTANPGTDNHVTWTQCQEMYANGWAIANHTNSGVALGGQAEAAQEAQILGGKTDLIANGMPLYTDHVAYVGGGTLYDANTMIAMANLGMKTGRAAVWFSLGPDPSGRISYLPPFDLYLGEVMSLDNTVTLATFQSHIDNTIAQGNIYVPLWHGIGEGGTTWNTADFQAAIDYLVARKNQLAFLTIDDYYNLTLGPVRVLKAK